MCLLSGQLKNVNQALASIQKMEIELRRELQKMAGEQLLKIAGQSGVLLPGLNAAPGSAVSALTRGAASGRSGSSVDDREIRFV